MVTRKPVPSQAESLAPRPISPPYPVTPTAVQHPHTFRVQDARQGMRDAGVDSESESVWGKGSEAPGKQPTSNALPESLRVGPARMLNTSSREAIRLESKGVSNATSQEGLRPNSASTNPFLKQAQHGATKESSAEAWNDISELSAGTPTIKAPPVPQNQPLSHKFANLNTSREEPSTNPWHPDLHDTPTQPPPLPTLQHEDSGNAAWSADPPARPAPAVPPIDEPGEPSQQPVLVDLEESGSPAWDDDEASPIVQDIPVSHGKESQQITEDRHVWDDDEGHILPKDPVATSLFVAPEDSTQSGEGWNLVDREAVTTGAQKSGIMSSNGPSHPSASEADHAPPLPPRISMEAPVQPARPEEHASAQPSRPTIITDARSNSSVNTLMPSSATIRIQKKETYEIKKISWYDANASQNPRISPILVQNLNGPCPLLALVNALTLSTPAGVETALVETLRCREQVSLGLLLDAVFDELMSGRRGDAAQDLPDVSDLYSFLLALHTGMNVNPRFFPLAAGKASRDPRNSISHLHPSEREAGLPGTFEDTREMKLYSTFSVPLIHGWIPERDSPAYVALSRSAKSYEEAQNLMFNEEPLEEKLHHDGLNFEEQATLDDIGTIKAFFASNATQLTPFGLSTITASVAPGSVAILFRNDHFSTLYRHPQTLQLLQLVTDMGYAGHEEVVWESLTDVNGENAEFFSGDFRLVGGASATPSGTQTHESGNGWTTVTGRRSSATQNNFGHRSTPSSSSIHADPIPETPHSPNIEQEDHDLALALQLQEEEEQQHEQEQVRRRRETELSQQYIEQSGAGGNNRNSNVPVSRGGRGGGRGRARARGSVSGRGQTTESRPVVPPRTNQPAPADPEAGVDAPPPYEHAANQPAYSPPADHPPHPNQSPVLGRSSSAYSATSLPQTGRGRRATGSYGGRTLYEQIPNRPPPPQVQKPQEKEKDCVVM